MIEEFSYSLKWDIQMSIAHKEMMLNLVAQGYFGEFWEMFRKNDAKAIAVFAREIHDMQYQFIADNLECWKK